jgi:hypothetical protein
MAKLPQGRAKRIVVAVVLAVLGAGVGVAYAVPLNCPDLWRWLGICG